MNDAAAKTALLLLRAESEIGLIDRTRPVGLEQEFSRLLAAWCGGQPAVPCLRYGRVRPLATLQRTLEHVIARGEQLGSDQPWLTARAAELLLEAQLADAVGTKPFLALACQRFAQPTGALAAELESLARDWIAEGARIDCSEPRYCSDDRSAPQSLWSVLAKRIGKLRAPFGIRVDRDLMSVAACSENAVVIRGGTWLTERAAKRIAAHEIEGHLLPRYAAKRRLDPLRCGCAGSPEDEEGRALLIEQRQGLMDAWRRAELGTRHLVCAFVRRGVTFVDAVRCLLALGVPIPVALRSTLRAIRGGGLAREIVYLPALRRIERAFTADPELEQWFRAGRASLSYASSQRAAAFAAA